MKTIQSIIAATMLISMLSACGTNTNTSPTPTPQATTQAEKDFENAADDTGDVIKAAGDAVGNTVEGVTDTVGDAVR